MGMALSDDGRFCVANYFPGGQPLVKPCQAMNHEHEVVINEYKSSRCWIGMGMNGSDSSWISKLKSLYHRSIVTLKTSENIVPTSVGNVIGQCLGGTLEDMYSFYV